MATRVFADEELERLRGFSEISREELFRYFTLTPADLAFVDPGRGRGPADRLGLAVALCTLPWLGFVPDRLTAAPPVAVARLAEQLRVDRVEIGSYGRRAKTRTEHARLAAQYLGWRPAGPLESKELDEFLLARAMEHDSPTLLFRLGCEYLISARVIRPGPVTVVERVAHARHQAQTETYDRLARDHGHLAALDLSYNYLRQFTPAVLSAVRFAGGTAATELLIAVDMLRELNATGRRKVFDEAPAGFVPTKWHGYLDEARKSGSVTAYRHYWELCVLLGLRDGLRSGDVYVPGSRRYADPAAYLLTTNQWAPQRAEFCRLVGKPADPGEALAAVTDELHEAVGELEDVLSGGDGPVRVDETGDLVISPLTAEDVPDEAKSLKAELTEMLPFAPIVSPLIELDKRTGYLDCFTHASGKHTRTPELKRNLIAVLLAHSTNLGLTRMAEACGISYDILAWTSEWYVRDRDPARGEPRDHRLPPAASADHGIRRRYVVVERRAAVPSPGQVDLGAGDGHPRRPGAVDLHPCHRSARHLRHEDHRRHQTRSALRAR